MSRLAVQLAPADARKAARAPCAGSARLVCCQRASISVLRVRRRLSAMCVERPPARRAAAAQHGSAPADAAVRRPGTIPMMPPQRLRNRSSSRRGSGARRRCACRSASWGVPSRTITERVRSRRAGSAKTLAVNASRTRAT